MPYTTEQEARRKCKCKDCEELRIALKKLDEICQDDVAMAGTHIEAVCAVREILSKHLGMEYDASANAYV